MGKVRRKKTITFRSTPHQRKFGRRLRYHSSLASTEEGHNDTKKKWAEFSEKTLCTSNNTLVEKWVKDLKATETTRLADLTNGEGIFTKNIKNLITRMLSPMSIQMFSLWMRR